MTACRFLPPPVSASGRCLRLLVGTTLAFLGLTILTGCSDDGDGSDQAVSADLQDGTEQTASAADAAQRRGEAKQPVTVGVTDWTGARLNVAIAELIIERRLGYPVELVEISDNRIMIDDLGANELDVVLEVWPSGLAEREWARVETGEVTNLGPLGVVGKNGWFVPRYVLDDDPAIGSWEGLTDPARAGRFATAATGQQGRFLGTDPSWDQHDADLIEALDLPFQIEYSGSEEATSAELARVTDRREPILLYWFTPSAQITEYDLVPVALPARSAECVAQVEAGGLEACDYAEEQLLKLGAGDLADRLPDLHRFVTRFTIATDEQVRLIDLVDNQGLSVTEVATAWVDENRSQWEPWLS